MLQTSLEHDPSKGQYSRGLKGGRKSLITGVSHTLVPGTGAFRNIYDLLEASVCRATRNWGQRDRVSSWMKGQAELGEQSRSQPAEMVFQSRLQYLQRIGMATMN